MERFSMLVAVHLFLIKEDKILLSRRFNTGYEDGYYSVVAGHVDGNETDKCDDLSWFSMDNLPDNMVGYVDSAINNYLNNIAFSLFDW